ncbi:MAG: hypothetical protein CMH64_02950 [Nanoarchaeota archaeon]|jgi:DNA repair exonuclease SbcCD nuclease subunit|nr:hypothetical protein [Nanoarchaeota archaeon]|tara:strand:- start:580 stop:1479 length:900 start_codon:yes stop_codon:yes gene_type:complete
MKKTKTPDYILSSDWHVRGTKPICRTDDYIEAQTKKIKFILSLAEKYDCPILIAGDLGHKPIWGDKLLNYFIDILNRFPSVKIYTICGQHDLINHRLDKWEEGGIGLLNRKKCIKVLTKEYKDISPFSYNDALLDSNKSISLVHKMIIKSQEDKLWDRQEADHAKKLLKKLSGSKLIVTGDNHQSFVIEQNNRLLVNAGSIMRMSANQVDHKPSIYLWYADNNSVERVYLPITGNVINRDHIDVVKERNQRIEVFVNKLQDNYELGLNFEKNMEEFLDKNDIDESVKEKIWEHINDTSE